MPRLPDATALGQRPIPNAGRAIATYDTGQVPRALSLVAAGLDPIAEKMQREDDETAFFAARRALNDWEREAVYNPETGAAIKQGQQAFGISEGLAKSFDDYAGKIAEGLKSDRQRKAFAELSQSRRQQVLEWADKHSLREREVFHLGEFKADLASFKQRAALKEKPEEAAAEVAMIRQRVHAFWAGKKPTPEIQQEIAAHVSDAHAGVLRSMLEANRVAEADAYYKAYGKHLDDKDRALFLREFKPREAAIKASDNATVLWGELGPKETNDAVRLADLKAKARALYAGEPEMLRQVMQVIDEKAHAHNAQQSETNAANVNSVLAAYDKKTPLSKLQTMPAYRALPATKQREIDRMVEQDIRMARAEADSAEARKDRAEMRAEREQLRRTENAYYIYSKPENLSQMSRAEVEALRPIIGGERTHALLAKHADLGKGGMIDARLDDDQFKVIAKRAGLKVDNRNDEDTRILRNAVEDRLHLLQKQRGGPLNREEKGQLIQSVVDEKIMLRNKLMSDDERIAVLVKDDQAGRAYVRVPMVKDGKPVTREGKPVLEDVKLSDMAEFMAKRNAARRERGLLPLTTAQAAAEFAEFRNAR